MLLKVPEHLLNCRFAGVLVGTEIACGPVEVHVCMRTYRRSEWL